MKKTGISMALIALMAGVMGSAHADFVVVPSEGAKVSVSTDQAEQGVVTGFGKSVPFADLAAELAPDDWLVVAGDKSIMATEVDWTGGRDWQSILRTVAGANGWKMRVEEEVKIVGFSLQTKATDMSLAVIEKPAVDGDDTSQPAEVAVATEAVKAEIAKNDVPVTMDVVTGSLDDKITVNLRGETLDKVLQVLAPQGWKVDAQFSPALLETVVDYTAQKTRAAALSEVLAPIGLDYLPYPSMSPAPLLVVVKGAR